MLKKDFEDKLDTICLKNKFGFNGKELLEFSKKATQLREKFKFEYTKSWQSTEFIENDSFFSEQEWKINTEKIKIFFKKFIL